MILIMENYFVDNLLEKGNAILSPSFPKCFFGDPAHLKPKTCQDERVYLANNNSIILEIIQNSLPEEGIFFQTETGSIQLKIDDHYFEDLLPLVEENIYASAYDLCSSSILAFTSEEVKMHHISLDSLPSTATFNVIGCYGREPFDNDEIAKVWFLHLMSSDIEMMRCQKGLSPKVRSQDPYLVMAMEKYYYSLEDILHKQNQKLIISPRRPFSSYRGHKEFFPEENLS